MSYLRKTNLGRLQVYPISMAYFYSKTAIKVSSSEPMNSTPIKNKMDLPSLIKQELERRGWSQNQLSEKSGLTIGHLNRIIRNLAGNPRQATLVKIAKALEIPFARVADAAGMDIVNYSVEEQEKEFLSVVLAMPDLQDLIRVYQTLSYQHRLVVLAMVKGLAHYQEEKDTKQEE